jgi:FkbM family methyltransferase
VQLLPFVLRLLPGKFSERFYYRFLCGRTCQRTSQVLAKLRQTGKPLSLNVLRGDVIGDSLYYTGVYETVCTDRFVEIARSEGGIFVDIGANIGYYTLTWVNAREGNRCISVEASPRNLTLLKSNLELNGLEKACDLYPLAVSNVSGNVSFSLGPQSQTGWGGISDGSGVGEITVPCERLDNLISEEKHIRLLKIDVEGAEALVLEGMTSLLERRQVDEIWFEDNIARRSQLNISFERLIAHLKKHQYVVRQGSEKNPLPMDFIAFPVR